MPTSLRRRALFATPLLLPFVHAVAQELPGKRSTLSSKVLKEERAFQVVLPEGYWPGSPEKYDVLYVLDGDGNARLFPAILQFLREESFLPPVIVVSVFNTVRERDFAPTAMAGWTAPAGADAFLRFLHDELMPHINKSYPSTGYSALFGQSLGGLLAMYALLTKPQAFDAYLAADPSFWWDNGYINKLAAEKLSAASLAGKSLFIAGREGEAMRQMGVQQMEAELKSHAPQGLNWKVASYADESHGSVRLKCLYDGLKFIYTGYALRKAEFHPMNGTVLQDQPYSVHYMGPYQAVHYTTDGSEPTLASPKMGPENTLTNGARLTARALDRKDRFNQSTVGEFKVGQALAAVEKPAGVQPGGLRYAYYEGDWGALPDFSKLTPVKTGLADKDFDVTKLPRGRHFGCLLEGFIDIQQAGYHVFVMDSDDGSRLYVGNQLLISHDGTHAAGNFKSYLIPLEKGFHPIRIEYFQGGGGAFLGVWYQPPGMAKPGAMPIPFERQYSSR